MLFAERRVAEKELLEMCLGVASAIPEVTFIADCERVIIWRDFLVRVHVVLLNQRLLLSVPLLLPLPLSKSAEFALGSSASMTPTSNQSQSLLPQG